jgi:hypothetical protein
MGSSGFPSKIVPGGTLSAAEVVGNFEALRDEVNALRDRNFELGAINTRHISDTADGDIGIKTQRSKDFSHEFGSGAFVEAAKLTNSTETDGIEFPTPSYSPAPEDEKRIPIFAVASFDVMTKQDGGSAIGIPIGPNGISDTLMAQISDNIAYEFKLQVQWNAGYSNATGFHDDYPGVGQPHTFRKITVGSRSSAPERSRVVIASAYVPPMGMKSFTFRLVARSVAVGVGVTNPARLELGYVIGSLFAFRGVR